MRHSAENKRNKYGPVDGRILRWVRWRFGERCGRELVGLCLVRRYRGRAWVGLEACRGRLDGRWRGLRWALRLSAPCTVSVRRGSDGVVRRVCRSYDYGVAVRATTLALRMRGYREVGGLGEWFVGSDVGRVDGVEGVALVRILGVFCQSADAGACSCSLGSPVAAPMSFRPSAGRCGRKLVGLSLVRGGGACGELEK